MTKILSGADIRGFYAALGVQLPGWAGADVSVRCFADPGAHSRGDRDPSCSINLTHGAWNCHGCGASGGPFDAAVCRGHTARSAVELMILHGLTQRRATASRQRQHHIHRSAYVRPRVDRPGRAVHGFRGRPQSLAPSARIRRSDHPTARARARLERRDNVPTGAGHRSRTHHDSGSRQSRAPGRPAPIPTVGKSPTDEDAGSSWLPPAAAASSHCRAVGTRLAG